MPNKVVSKYFATEKVMDDSLSDFQVEKKYNIGPKKVKKTRTIKKSKHIKGQKDIRKLIKKQENEVLSYTKDFDKVCKQVGVDVDSEELQLAVALSKSLHEVKIQSSSETIIETTEDSSSQLRIQSIKTTLQEYGFQVCKSKTIPVSCGKKFKKQKRKSLYKLLHTNEPERQQIISDKYSEILARNIFNLPVKNVEYDYNDIELYYKTTNIAYEHIKNNDVFYLKELFEKPPHRTCLLRDWSEIPGRPLSPTVQVSNINIDNITFDQHDLDCILSGSIYTAQHIVTNKISNITNISYNNNSTDISLRFDEPKHLETEPGVDEASDSKIIKVSVCDTKSATMSVSQVRCISPDLFDDEVSTVLESIDNDVQVSEQKNLMADNVHTYSMDLTECVNIDSGDIKSLSERKFNTNSDINVTNRRSNDFMEMTNCLSNCLKHRTFETVDLTQTTNDLNNQTDNDLNSLSQNENIEFMDLTQVPNFEAPSNKICQTNEDNLIEETIILVDEEVGLKFHQHNESLSDLDYCQPDEIDLTQSSDSTKEDIFNCQPISRYSLSLGKRDNISIDYDEVYDDIVKENNSHTSLSEICSNQNNSKEQDANQNDKVLNAENAEISAVSNKVVNYSLDQSKYDSLDSRNITVLNDKNSFIENEANTTNNDIVSHPSNSSEVFEISDNEFNYSLNQCKHDNFDSRDVTVMNHFLNDQNKSNTIFENGYQPLSESNSITGSMSTAINKIAQSHSNSNACTPIKSMDKNFMNVLQTPKNSDYIIKTSEVTPMLDYASMTSPERQKELEKYGLKPFKRKRAIQLLTYIYNQTHPIVDSHIDDCPSPSKRLKKDDNQQNSSTKPALKILKKDNIEKQNIITKPSSPSKIQRKDNKGRKTKKDPTTESIDATPDVNEQYLYAVTNEHPDITNIECDTEWIFQKREKAKLHSCRVPLHITFHNYVTCRRRLREAILRYEPVNIDVIYKDMVATGYRYNPKDLLKFMDRKCITVRTAENNGRNRKS